MNMVTTIPTDTRTTTMTTATESRPGPAARLDCSMLELIRMLQFGDSTLPTGAFSFSHGLESAIDRRVVHDATSLQAFVSTSLDQAAGGDGVALLQGFDAALGGRLDDVAKADQYVYNRKLNEETRTMTVRTGKKLLEAAGRMVPGNLVLGAWLARVAGEATPGTYPVSLAVVFATLGLPRQACFLVHQYGVASAILSSALRLMRVDHFDTQGILFRLNAGIEQSYLQAAPKSLEDMATYAPAIDVLAAIHVKAHVRLFMS